MYWLFQALVRFIAARLSHVALGPLTLWRYVKTSLCPFWWQFFPGEPGLAGFIEAKDDGSDGDNWSCKSCKAPARSSPLTNQHPVILQAGCPSCRPTNSVKALKGNITFHGLAYPKLNWGLPTLSLTTNRAPGYLGWVLPCLSSALWCRYPRTMKLASAWN